MAPSRRNAEVLTLAGREVTVTNPAKVYFPKAGITKLELIRYYLAVAEGALRAVRDRPMALKRYVDGAEGEFFFQKRAPESRPPWIEVVELAFPSGRTASEVVVRGGGAAPRGRRRAGGRDARQVDRLDPRAREPTPRPRGGAPARGAA